MITKGTSTKANQRPGSRGSDISCSGMTLVVLVQRCSTNRHSQWPCVGVCTCPKIEPVSVNRHQHVAWDLPTLESSTYLETCRERYRSRVPPLSSRNFSRHSGPQGLPGDRQGDVYDCRQSTGVNVGEYWLPSCYMYTSAHRHTRPLALVLQLPAKVDQS